jgi:hypothetical protein
MAGAAIAAAVLLGGQVLPGRGDGARADGPCAAEARSLGPEEQAFLDALNTYRASHGLGELIPTVSLRRSAAWHAASMAEGDYFSHHDSLGRDPSGRAMDCGYPTWVAENIAAGTDRESGPSALELFLGSPPHLATLSDPNARYIGIARAYNASSRYRWYWVTDFGAVEDPAGVLAASPARAGAATGSAVRTLDFARGWNLVTWTGPETPLATVFATTTARAIYTYDPGSGTWGHALKDAPAYANTLRAMVPGAVYWVVAD